MRELTGLDGPDLEEWIQEQARYALGPQERLRWMWRETLTDSEREAIAAAARGLTRDESADLLRVKPETIKSRLKIAMRKTGCRNTTNLVAWAIATGQFTHQEQEEQAA
jgi:DNA-binding CsgD family transcriptional regulator